MESLPLLTEQSLTELRQSVRESESPSRFAHTCSVEAEVERIAKLLLPEKVLPLRAAALLHDLTKELPLKEHLRICSRHEISCSAEAASSVAVLHGLTAAEVIRERFPLFASEEILSAVRKHTVGAAEMSAFDKILFLADYIESTRSYPDCIALRESFWRSIVSCDDNARSSVLDFAVYTEIKQTLSNLLQRGAVIAPESLPLYNRYAARKDWQG